MKKNTQAKASASVLVESGPMPVTAVKGRHGREYVYPFDACLDVGAHFFVPRKQTKQLSSYVCYANKHLAPWRFEIFKDTKGGVEGVRIRRMK
jgi:hypothetical protein